MKNFETYKKLEGKVRIGKWLGVKGLRLGLRAGLGLKLRLGLRLELKLGLRLSLGLLSNYTPHYKIL
jgi:hypothetical protein